MQNWKRKTEFSAFFADINIHAHFFFNSREVKKRQKNDGAREHRNWRCHSSTAAEFVYELEKSKAFNPCSNMLISCKCLNILLKTDSRDDRSQFNQLSQSIQEQPKQPAEVQKCPVNTDKLTGEYLHFFKIVSKRARVRSNEECCITRYVVFVLNSSTLFFSLVNVNSFHHTHTHTYARAIWQWKLHDDGNHYYIFIVIIFSSNKLYLNLELLIESRNTHGVVSDYDCVCVYVLTSKQLKPLRK